MNRRDTIILAILVNAGLLMLLFATAVRTGESSPKPQNQIVAKVKDSPKKSLQTVAKAEEELDLDHFLKMAPPSLKTKDVEEVVIAKETLPPPVPAVVEKPIQQEEVKGDVVKVTIKKGDFLEKIAKAHHTTVAAIMKANKLSSTNLKVGQVLTVPVGEKKKSSGESSSQASEYYVVKEGDNPWVIASKNRIRLEELLKINGLDEAKARKLRPGDRLKIR